MVLGINTLQAVESYVRVNLRGGNVSMPEYGLDRAQVSSVLDHVRRAGMPQHVRTRTATTNLRSVTYQLPEALPAEAPSSDTEKQ